MELRERQGVHRLTLTTDLPGSVDRNQTGGSEGVAPPSVLLVSMPWTTLTEPSPGLGILKAVLAREGIPCRVLHVNLFLLQHLHAYTYEALSVVFALNDFLFSGTLDPGVTNEQQRWLREKVRELLADNVIDHRKLGGPEGVVETMLRLRNEILPAWMEGWADEVASQEATLVGFTCMFDQTVASLALAKMVRERAPEKMIAFGGVAARTPTAQMLLRSHSWVDAICDGDGEGTIIPLARASVGAIPLERVPGIVYRSETREPVSSRPAPPVDLDTVPFPDYDDYFADLRRLSDEHLVDISPVSLPMENSRGCWWGQKSHCVFCGIRDEDMAYRARGAQRVLDAMAALSERYGMTSFRFSDYILPIQYFDTLLPELARMGRPYRLSSEMKANITEERFSLLANAGFHEAQLGIESFSSDVLRKMHKGVTGAQNVYSLMLGKQFGVRVLYNILYGFPDDDLDAYLRMTEQLHHLIHLDPPISCVPVQITRFAPLQSHPERFGIEDGAPANSYALIFSRDYLKRTGFDMRDFCYYFERTFENPVRLQSLYERLNEISGHWRVAATEKTAWLYREMVGETVIVHDGRAAEERVYELEPGLAALLAKCEAPVALRALHESGDPAEVDAGLEALMERGLIYRDEARVVSLLMPGLPAPVNRPTPSRILPIFQTEGALAASA